MTRTDRHDATGSDDPTADRASTPMRDVSHTHPHAARGTVNRPFERGPVVAADGGEREAYRPDEQEEEDDEPARMKDVSHTPPHDDGESADRVFERGGEYRAVEPEE